MADSLGHFDQSGRTAIVTGGSRGVGFGIASALAQAGAAVVLTGRDSVSLDRAVTQLSDRGFIARGCLADSLSREDNESTVAFALDEFGRIDILVNNVGGTAGVVPFQELDRDRFLFDYARNVGTALEMSQLVAPHLNEQEEGFILNISSRSAQLGSKGFTSYSVAKAALERLTKMMALELSPRIRVNAISIGAAHSEMLQVVFDTNPGMAKILLDSIPLGRIAESTDLGTAALYLCSRHGYATGVILPLDGGLNQPVR